MLRYNGKAIVTTQPASKTSAPQKTVIRYAVNTQLPIIKRGSIGKVVKIWQIIMGVEADGEFGSMTHNATIQFQGAYGLEQDGEVGPKTWAAGLGKV